MSERVTDYLGELHAAVTATRVTDAEGSVVDLDGGASAAVQMILAARDAKRKVMVVGNGGSAAIASHLANDLLKAVGVRAMVFTDAAVLTALTNDDGYETAYAQQVERWAEADDLLLAISSSGGSENILQAVTAAKLRGAAVITFSGFDPKNALRRRGDVNFYVPAYAYGPVEMAHAVLGHYLTDAAAARDTETATEGFRYEIKTTRAGDWWSRLRGRRASA